MSSFIDYFAENVDRMLDAEPASANDLVNLSVGGEQLRRAIASTEPGEVSARASQALARYDQFLASKPTGWPDDLDEELDAALLELKEFSDKPRLTRDFEEGTAAFSNIEHILATACASTRSGQFAEDALRRLAERARPAVHELTPALLDLAQYAEDRRLQFAHDPDYSYLYGHCDELAEFAPSRLEAQEALSEAVRRQSMVEKAIADYMLPSLVERVSAALVALAERGKAWLILDAAVRPAFAPSHASAEVLPQLEHVSSLGELDVLRSATHLHLLVPDGHRLQVISAVTEQGDAQHHEQFGNESVRIELPQQETELRLELELDGVVLDLPSIPVRARSL